MLLCQNQQMAVGYLFRTCYPAWQTTGTEMVGQKDKRDWAACLQAVKSFDGSRRILLEADLHAYPDKTDLCDGASSDSCVRAH